MFRGRRDASRSAAAAAESQKEVRIDPEDGQPRTFEELRAASKGRYSDREIQDYWENEMIRHVGEGIHSVAADPFLTHVSQNEAAAAAKAASVPTVARRDEPPVGSLTSLESVQDGLANVLKDPFLAADKYKGPTAVREGPQDPFATGPGGPGGEIPSTANGYGSVESLGPSRHEKVSQAILVAQKTAMESLFSLLGPGDVERDLSTKNMLVFGPWLLYLWVILMRIVMSHYAETVTVVLICFTALACLGMVFVWFQGSRGGPVSLLAAGGLGLIATTAGSCVGSFGYDNYYRQYWWTQTGFRGGVTTAETPAMARTDFAVLNFWDADKGTTYNQSRVATDRAAGYKDTQYYCVAPILSPDMAGAALIRVNFWAVGIDCCQRSGKFTCDGSREWNAGTGIVMLDGGFPCPTCNSEKFRLAVSKAESIHGLVSAPGAKFVRFVQDPSGVETSMLLMCLGFLLLAALLGGVVCGLLGWLAWYYGLGISGPHGGVPASVAGDGSKGDSLMLPMTTPLKAGQIVSDPGSWTALKRR